MHVLYANLTKNMIDIIHQTVSFSGTKTMFETILYPSLILHQIQT